jgi:hypothetical protein
MLALASGTPSTHFMAQQISMQFFTLSWPGHFIPGELKLTYSLYFP